ncbi:MAG: hypothetical protein ABJA67_00775 [Chthonomonadales bacterium]
MKYSSIRVIEDVKGNYSVHDTNAGFRMVLERQWNNEHLTLLKSRGITMLTIFRSNQPSLDFLKLLPELTSLTVSGYDTCDASEISGLVELQDLQFHCKSKPTLDLTRLVNLESLRFWSDSMPIGLEYLRNLQFLYLERTQLSDLQRFENCSKLTQIRLDGGALSSFKGIQSLEKLSVVEFSHLRKLNDLSELTGNESIHKLRISACKKIPSVAVYATMPNLVSLQFWNCGVLDTLKPLEGNQSLVDVFITDNTRVADGDLGPIARIPTLKHFWVQDQRSFSHRNKDLPKMDNDERLALIDRLCGGPFDF